MRIRTSFVKLTRAAVSAAFVLFTAFAFPADALVREDHNLLYKISIPFVVGGEAAAATPEGDLFPLGRVIALPKGTRWPSYSASAWGVPGEVCASAVNAIHMLVSVEKDKGRTMSLVPQETIAPAAGTGASLVLSSVAGTGIFGAWAPPVGSKIGIIRKNSTQMTAFSEKALPKEGDTLIISVQKSEAPYMADIENRPGGRLILWDKDGYRTAARVVRPMAGTGRFEGTLFQRQGALRANHCGVMDFSSSPLGEIGGFQVIPWDHALLSKEMQGAWDMTQWMIIAPADGRSMMGGTYPLFQGALVPGPSKGEIMWDIWSTYGRRSLILIRQNGGPWQTIPPVSGRNDYAYKEVTHIRIYFPFTDEPGTPQPIPSVR